MVETEGAEKNSDQIITDFLYMIKVPIPTGLIPRLFTNKKDKNINANTNELWCDWLTKW